MAPHLRPLGLRRTVVTALVLLAVGCAPVRPDAARDPCVPAVPGGDVLTRDVAGTSLHVTVAGPVGAPAVVLLHGFPETASTWRAVATDLAADHRVVVPDLRGAGCSRFAPPGTDAYATADLAADLGDLAVALDLPPATVVGHDLGAMTAVAWARARPQQVASLVLSGGGVPGLGLAERGPPHLRSFGGAPPGAVEEAQRGRVREFLAGFTGSPAFPLDEAVAAYAPPGRLDAAMGRYGRSTATPSPSAPTRARSRCRCSSSPAGRRTWRPTRSRRCARTAASSSSRTPGTTCSSRGRRRSPTRCAPRLINGEFARVGAANRPFAAASRALPSGTPRGARCT